MQHPITVIMRSFGDVNDQTQVLNAILRSFLATVTAKVDFSDTHHRTFYLLERQATALGAAGQSQEAEGKLPHILSTCTAVYGTCHLLTIRVRLDLAWLNFHNQNYATAKALFQSLLHDSSAKEDPRTRRFTEAKALNGLARIAIQQQDYEKAERFFREGLHILMGLWGPKDEEIIYAAHELEKALRKSGKDSEADDLSASFGLEDHAFT
jgi:tetratricopeptide (TPR) repeat protein